jgi:hypothetical protein
MKERGITIWTGDWIQVAYIHTYIYIHTRNIYAQTYIHVYIYVHTNIHIHTYTHIHTCIHTHTYTYICMYTYIHACMYIQGVRETVAPHLVKFHTYVDFEDPLYFQEPENMQILPVLHCLSTHLLLEIYS